LAHGCICKAAAGNSTVSSYGSLTYLFDLLAAAVIQLFGVKHLSKQASETGVNKRHNNNDHSNDFVNGINLGQGSEKLGGGASVEVNTPSVPVKTSKNLPHCRGHFLVNE